MKLGIVGATGFAGLELLRILSKRLEDEITVVTSRREKGKKLTSFYPALSKLANYDQLKFIEPENLGGQADLFFIATKQGDAMPIVPKLLDSGAKVIDLSADFRYRDVKVFEKWYFEHIAPELLPKAVYGLPELYAQEIKKADLVANPGCYPTSVILALAPVLKAQQVDFSQAIIADSKSGVTGAGRGPTLGNSFCQVYDNLKSYKTVGHKHASEMIQEIGLLSGTPDFKLSFTPHLVPINRGILSTVYFKPKSGTTLAQVRDIYQKFYQDAYFVRLREEGYDPQTADVRGTNFCDLAVIQDEDCGLFKIISVLDNLGRGCSGQAVANLNLITGKPENYCLDLPPLRP